MEEFTHKPNPHFYIRLVGTGIKPWIVPMRALARVMDAVQRLVDQREDEFEAEGEGIVGEQGEKESAGVDVSLRALRLVGLTTKSAGYAVASTTPEIAISVLSETGKSIRSPQNAEWSGSQISSIKDLSEVAKSQGCVIEFRESGRGGAMGDVLAKITPLTFDEISGSAFVYGDTSIYGRLERIGGATEPHCGLRIADQPKMVICHIAGTELIRKMGQYLYQDIIVTGEAKWLRHNWQIRDMKITSFEAPKTGEIRDVLERMWQAGGKEWDKVRDSDKVIQRMRGV
jgi:hypothetical protein